MQKQIDIRDQPHLSGEKVLDLNFIKNPCRYAFRKYYRFGLRSHIFEVVSKKDILKETTGERIDGILVFPRAKPKKMFRILRNRFQNTESVFNEIKKYNMLLHLLGPDLIAKSEEFIVEYNIAGKKEIVLCGLQEYVEGEIMDPWRIFGKTYLENIYKATSQDSKTCLRRTKTAHKNIELFAKKIRHMINEAGFIPDLAGLGNLILTQNGFLKLVDINNIVEIKLDDEIRLDDKEYPSCDVSIEVLSILESCILEKKISMDDPLYKLFLSPQRRKKVKQLERKFYSAL